MRLLVSLLPLLLLAVVLGAIVLLFPPTPPPRPVHLQCPGVPTANFALDPRDLALEPTGVRLHLAHGDVVLEGVCGVTGVPATQEGK